MVLNAWQTYRGGGAPLMLEAQMSDALAGLTGAVNTRQPAEARQAALAVTRAVLDLQLQHRAAAEVDFDRLIAWTCQTLVDADLGELAWVRSDAITVALIRDRMVQRLDAETAAGIDAPLTELSAAAKDGDLEAVAEIAGRLLEQLTQPGGG